MDFTERTQNHVTLAGIIKDNPVMVPLEKISGAPFLIVEIRVVIIDEKQHVSGNMIREPQELPVYFYGATAEKVLKEARRNDNILIEAKLKSDIDEHGIPRVRVVGRRYYVCRDDADYPDEQFQQYEERYERYQ